jgi:V8-like Glu-specific endopeptidase
MKNIKILIAALITVFITLASHGVFANELAGKTAPITLGTSHPYTSGNAGEIVESLKVSRQGAKFIIVHFSGFSINDGDYVEIRDANGTLRQTITNDYPGRTDFWAFAVDGDTAFVSLISGPSGGQAYGFDIDSYGYGISQMQIESICGSNNKIDIECVSGTAQYDRARSVGRMYFQDQNDGGWYYCTGSLISEQNHFLTNEHCINSQAAVDTLQVRFNYQYNTCNGSTLSSYDTFYGDTFLLSNYNYDFSLMTLTGDPQAAYGYLELDPRDIVLNEIVYIPQHSDGNPKKYDSGPVVNTVMDDIIAGSDFGHRVDTEGGSSGSPVLSINSHKVVGLHHVSGCSTNGGENQAVLMKHIYPYIESYLTGTGGSTTNLIQNYDFENGNSDWVSYDNSDASNITNDSEFAHSGSWFLYIGGYSKVNTNYSYQDIDIPSDVSEAYLQFYYKILTNETTTSQIFDTMKVQILNPSNNTVLTTLVTLSNLDKVSNWVLSQKYNVSAFKGQRIRLRFYATTDSSNSTGFLIDDINLMAAADCTNTYCYPPDLIMTALTFTPAKVIRGNSIAVTSITENRGNGIAGQSTIRYYLSANKKRDNKDILLTDSSSVQALNASASSFLTASITIPANKRTGSYYMIACADDTKQVSESNEKNNCKASKKKIKVKK